MPTLFAVYNLIDKDKANEYDHYERRQPHDVNYRDSHEVLQGLR